MTWQPIVTAPRNWQPVLVYDHASDTVGQAYFRDAEDEPGWLWANLAPEDEDCKVPEPTHWMPLPDPPVMERER